MGRVYLAYDRQGHQVAIKVIRDDLRDDPTFRARFEREARAAGAVSGRCVAALLGSDLTSKVPYLATEYVPGPTLDQHIKEHGPLDSIAVTQLAIGLAEGLAAIHRAGIVHRDLSPRNIILAPRGPTIIDFGVARQTDATTITATGASLGTPSWMSPEQIRGEEVTQAADIFALGAILVYASTGLAPFAADRPEASAYRVVHEDPDLSSVPTSLVEVVRNALTRAPSQRPTAQDLLASLAGTTEPREINEAVERSLRSWPFRTAASPTLAESRFHLRRRTVAIAATVALVVSLAALALINRPAHSTASSGHQPHTGIGHRDATPTRGPTTVSLATTSSSTPVSTSVVATTPSGTLQQAESFLRSRGYVALGNPVPPDTGAGAPSFWQLDAIPVGTVDGGGDRVFFFVGPRFVGTDTTARNPSGQPVELDFGGATTIALNYSLYHLSDPECCPSAGAKTVRFDWTGTSLKRLDPLPPSDPNVDASRR